MKVKIVLVFLCVSALISFIGCGAADNKSVSPNEATEGTGTDSSATLDIQSKETPEGVADRFFTAFFSGQDEEARALLTVQAQEATRESFMTQASDTIRWNIVKKSQAESSAFVFIDVNDLNDEGKMEKEEMIFVLKNQDGRWGVAGFSAGDLAINYEETPNETVGQSNTEMSAEPQRVGQTETENTLR